MSRLRLYNTLTRSKVDFTPIDPAHVRMYVCGPTVYDYAHIGNARPVIVFDVLYRLLRHLYGKDHVTYVRNITDVDDKINARAAERGITIRELTEETNSIFQRDVKALGCLEPDVQPRATEHIADMISLISTLVEKGFAYAAEGHVLFSPTAMDRGKSAVLPRYGQLANRSLDEMIAGARVDVAPYKRDTTDFVLWKPSKDNEPGWDSPWGRGRPGWHIECSAMSWRRLIEDFSGRIRCESADANVFDIHGGGIDLVFPHHENEIAQSCCAFNASRMANVWMHNGFLQVEGEKMSKSTGNFVTINELLNTTNFGGLKWDGRALRWAMLGTHYRQPIDWTAAKLSECVAAMNRLKAWDRSPPKTDAVYPPFLEALCDDLNTPKAISELYALVNQMSATQSSDGADVARYSMLRNSLALLGIDSLANFGAGADPELSAADRVHVEALISARLAARAAKNWAESDRIRDELAAIGIALKDNKDGTTAWEVKR